MQENVVGVIEWLVYSYIVACFQKEQSSAHITPIFISQRQWIPIVVFTFITFYNMLILLFLDFSVLVLVYWHMPLEDEDLTLLSASPHFLKQIPFFPSCHFAYLVGQFFPNCFFYPLNWVFKCMLSVLISRLLFLVWMLLLYNILSILWRY